MDGVDQASIELHKCGLIATFEIACKRRPPSRVAF
jgi:hypothetical protein